MHHKVGLTLISLLLIMSGCKIAFSQPAQARRSYRPRIHRRAYRHHAKKRNRVAIRSVPAGVYPKDLLYYTRNGKIGYTRYYLSKPRYRTNMSKGYVKAVVRNEYRDLSRARQKIHERPLVQNSLLKRLANWRVKQAHQHFTHYDRKGRPLAWLDAEKMHLGSYRSNRRNIGENMFSVGKLSQVRTDSGVAGYYFKQPSDLAGDNVFDSLNNDAASQWSHGENIMMPKHRYVGIGTYYQRSNQTLYVMVEFSSKRPVVHKR